ncbi:extracellular solute-binding protein [Leadbettera azotonutricia]|uniref:Probable sugar-binding periplasmic protein n=1 Tax=Leadbettera azotonutricia (strain ATCC BAA-888 / DSM 13862 / ZAS-9) TaxID=545695 RepID=F5YET7_LEAAZ|nr:extracellular solute-binding protein [Leadbettera azotonutricia]AEF83522.1 extracellular solute-binding protein, family 1 [Leadbettera azotonutricia ZAS-9]
MKKTILSISAIALMAALALPLFAAGGKDAGASGKTVLTMGSWRTDDVSQMNKLLAEYQKIKPNVEIQFRPTNPPDYNATLRLQLDGGTGPDLMYARSYAPGQELFKAGYFADCTDIPGVTANFSASNRAPWQTPDGKMFAVPFAAVSHAVYYNKTIFQKEGLKIPQTWEEFLSLNATLLSKGYTPLANGVADEWDILECFYLGLVPNYIGGASERIQYESGAKKLNDANFVASFQALADVAKYLPKGFESVTYNDSQVLFNTQQAIMFMDGSWTAGVYAGASFDWGLFALPAPQGKKTAITFHPDMAITYNKATKHPQECKDFLAWLASKEGATTASENLPVGYFPMISFAIQLSDPHANEFLALNNGKETDARFVWPKFLDLYAPMNQAVIQVLKGEITPRQAADKMETTAAALR